MLKNKILFIITDFGSFNNFLSELSIYLIKNNGVEVVVICSSTKVININDKFNYDNKRLRFYFVNIPRGFNIYQQIKSSLKINSIIKFENPDIIHAHFTTAIFTTVLCKNKSTKIWGTFHGLGYVVSTGFRKILFNFVEYFSFSRLDRIILLNYIDYNKVPNIYKNRAIKANSLGLGCDLNLFNKDNFSLTEKLNLRKELNLQGQFILAFTGRFVHFKGFNIVAKSFLNISKQYNIKLLLIGGKDPIHKTGLTTDEENIIFKHKDIVKIGFSNYVNKFLSIVNLFIFPSKKEGVPIVVTEALAMGIPVITFNSRGCNELVKNNFNGILINENTDYLTAIDLFTKAIENLLKNRKLLKELKSNVIKDRHKLSRTHFIKEQLSWYLED